MRRLIIAATLLLLLPGAAVAQVTQTPPPVTFDDVFRVVTRDAFYQFGLALGTQRFQLDLTATQKGVGGMTKLETVKITSTASTPAAWNVEVRQQLPAKIRSLVAKVSTARIIGNPNSAPSKPDTLTVTDELRGVVFQTKHSEPGASGKRTLTLAVLVGR